MEFEIFDVNGVPIKPAIKVSATQRTCTHRFETLSLKVKCLEGDYTELERLIHCPKC